MPSTNLRTGSSQHDYSAAWLLYLASATLDDISTQLNIPYSTLAAFASRHKWMEMRQQALKNANKAIREDLTKRIEKHRTKHQHFIMDKLEHTQSHIEQMEIGDDKELGQVPIEKVLSIVRQHDDIARRTLKLDEDKGNDPVAQGFAVLLSVRGGQNTPSAMVTLPGQENANTGILSSNNAHPMTLEEGKNEPIDIESEQLKPMPKTISFKPPTTVEGEQQQDRKIE